MDEYIVDSEIMPGFLIYFKNGKLHREAGPAIISVLDKDKYFYLEDKDLYQNGKIKLDFSINITILAHLSSIINKDTDISYFIDGELCQKEQIYRDKFKKDLDAEVVTFNPQVKKLKI